MPRASATPLVSSINFYTSETNASTVAGTFMWDQIGRGYRYTLAGGTALVVGDLQQSSAEDTQFDVMATIAHVAGVTDISVTNGTTTVAANDFRDGTLTVSVGTTTIGQTFRILSHTTGASGATIVYSIEDPLQVALTTASKITVRPNPWRGVIIQPTTHTGAAVGGAVFAIPASKYGWLQTKGVGAALTDATVVAATTMGLSPSVSTAGCVTKHVNQDQYVGRSLVAVNVSAKVYPVIWQLD